MNKQQQLQQEIAELQKQLEEKQKALSAMPEKWEPKGGLFAIMGNGNIEGGCNSWYDFRNFGVEYPTREQAEKAAKAMRAHNRLLAYVSEFAPDYEFSKGSENCCVYFDLEASDWDYSCNYYHNIPSAVYMPLRVAVALVAKLNSGEVEL